MVRVSSSFVCSASSTSVLKAEQVVHLRAPRACNHRACPEARPTSPEDRCSKEPTTCWPMSKMRASNSSTFAFATCPASCSTSPFRWARSGPEYFEDGVNFDGSSIRGFQKIHESDMTLLPDPATAYIDPFRVAKTLIINFFVHDPLTKEPYSRDPRNIARKAESYLASTGIGDTAYFAPEAEFYMFDDVRFETKQQTGYYAIDSVAGAWNTGRIEDGGNRGYKVRYKGGYFPVPPVDHFADLRDSIVRNLEASGLKVERAHHEVGTAGQAEINYRVRHDAAGRRRPAEVQVHRQEHRLGCG